MSKEQAGIDPTSSPWMKRPHVLGKVGYEVCNSKP